MKNNLYLFTFGVTLLFSWCFSGCSSRSNNCNTGDGCNSRGICNIDKRLCVCDQGYAGDRCQTCADGYKKYGDACYTQDIPELTDIDGDGTAATVVDGGGATLGIQDRQPANHRFQDSWLVSGNYLNNIVDLELHQDGGDTVFKSGDGLKFQKGDTNMTGKISLPAALVIAGAYTLVINSPGGKVEAKTFILQGEKGEGADSNCPGGYQQDTTRTDGVILCKKTFTNVISDEMVKVGDFWIDRYEMSLWTNSTCDGTPYGIKADDAQGQGFLKNGNWTVPMYGCSITGVQPAGIITWFQAQQACVLSGKVLCTNEQWQAAAAGTLDKGAYDGYGGGACNTASSQNKPRMTGKAADIGYGSCISVWGAEDMIGNVWEWVSGWLMEPGSNENSPWPDSCGGTYGSDAYVHGGELGDTTSTHLAQTCDAKSEHSRTPTAPLRGGSYGEGISGGINEIWAGWSPSNYSAASTDGHVGARCCRSR